MQEKLLLNQARNVDADKSSTTIPINLSANRDIIVDDNFNQIVNEYNVYLDEREPCTTIRLTAKVNLLASNVIFNSISEIVKDEGSDACSFLNYESKIIGSTIGKVGNEYHWGPNLHDAIMDTQISWDGMSDKNYTYLCGIDIFDNHILRSKSKYAPYYYQEQPYGGVKFNTLDEILTDVYKTPESVDYFIFSANKRWIRRYTTKNTISYLTSLNTNLIERGGWLGFLNKSQILVSNLRDVYYGNSRVLNNQTSNKFIDLFPGRDRYSLLPHYNKYRDRYEKNWEYCLTYPYSSTTEEMLFINQGLNTLKIAFIDENGVNDDGIDRCVIYSICKHGLNVDDTIVLYRSTLLNEGENYEQVDGSFVVDSVIDDYVFSVTTTDFICNRWVPVLDETQLDACGVVRVMGDEYFYTGNTANTLSILAINDYLNLDFDEYDGNSVTHIGSQNLSFAKVVDGIQCKYYVRLFSRFPNFDFYDKVLTEENIYSGDIGERPIDIYSTFGHEKQSTMSKLGFSKNVYGDDICGIVYNDDINIDVIKDNLGRPLTSLYLSFFKTNYGYIDWYRYDSSQPDNMCGYSGDTIEWSRCFGKLNCGFEYSPHLPEFFNKNLTSNSYFGNIHYMNNINANLMSRGLKQKNAIGEDNGNLDEIKYKEQNIFYGDLCMYSAAECLETQIQGICHRFNTAQRELDGYNVGAPKIGDAYYTVVKDDQYDSSIVVYDDETTKHPEGCYYYSNYEIPIRTFDTKISEFVPDMILLTSINDDDLQDREYIITTAVENHFNVSTKLYLYDIGEEKHYKCSIENVLDLNKLKITIDGIILDLNNPMRYQIYSKDEIIPDYAEILPSNSGRYRWRDIIPNGFEETDGLIEEYPFVNGCLYINKEINLFLRRQDPFGYYGLSSGAIYYGLTQLMGEKNPAEDEYGDDNYTINESDIRC